MQEEQETPKQPLKVEKSTDEILQNSSISPSETKLPNMEVHHHPDLNHTKKNFREYLLEFVMIFLAVTLGFFAENIREHITEKEHEIELAKALYSELNSDSVVASTKLTMRLEKESFLAYVGNYIQDSNLNNLPKKFYPAFTEGLYILNIYAFEPKDGILSQLRNSGSLRYFKSIELQKLFGDISVCINNMRARNDQEYQYFTNPIKPFLIKYYSFNWLDEVRKEDNKNNILEIINNYLKTDSSINSEILNLRSFDRREATNIISMYKQVLISTQTLQLNDYIITNHRILEGLRKTYNLSNE